MGELQLTGEPTEPIACAKCLDTGIVNKVSGGGTEPRTPGTPQVYGMCNYSAPCSDVACMQRRMAALIKELPA